MVITGHILRRVYNWRKNILTEKVSSDKNFWRLFYSFSKTCIFWKKSQLLSTKIFDDLCLVIHLIFCLFALAQTRLCYKCKSANTKYKDTTHLNLLWLFLVIPSVCLVFHPCFRPSNLQLQLHKNTIYNSYCKLHFTTAEIVISYTLKYALGYYHFHK